MFVRNFARSKETVVLAPRSDDDVPLKAEEAPVPFGAGGEFANLGSSSSTSDVKENNEERRDTLLVIFPGSFLSPSQYEPLAKALQEKSSTKNHRVFVVVPKFMKDIYGELAASVALDECIELAADAGFQVDAEYGGGRPSKASGFWQATQLFVLGHSWGGFMMRPIALERAAGAIFLNSYLGVNHDFKTGVTNPIARFMAWSFMDENVYPTNIAQWPKPVLLLGGDRDGQVRLSYFAEAAAEVDAFRKEANVLDEQTYAEKSVVVIGGLNHSKHVEGAEPNLKRGDTESSWTGEAAVDKVASACSAFIFANRLGTPLAHNILRNFEVDSRRIVEALILAGIGNTEKGQMRELAQVVQKRIANVSKLSSANVSMREFTSQRLFMYSKPSVTRSASVASVGASGDDTGWRINVCALKVLRDTANGGKNNSRNRLGEEIWLKLKSREALMGAPLLLPSAGGDGPQDAQQINDFMFSRALEVVSSEARDRYVRRGRPLVFLPDTIVGAGPKWLNTPVTYTLIPATSTKPEALGICCPSGTSPMSMPGGRPIPERFAGMHYVKLPSFASMVEYILVDAFLDASALFYATDGAAETESMSTSVPPASSSAPATTAHPSGHIGATPSPQMNTTTEVAPEVEAGAA